MFYSQFILAKKGPLGTIWIAAHLERKLRKNQVADTDIGVSVDSILTPDVPIALRLSSHLLLGVVRIYSRKVNYLFDDCSDALLKVKQAFRSAAVDLPPEESKAPYHSITLPETFDLEDFELPDNDIFQGNSVDHHISSIEQITLQDNVGGAGYSTSKFGLDERFGDGDAFGLDLDEELFLDKIGSAGQGSERSDPQASDDTMITLRQDENPETTGVNSGLRVDDVDDYADPMDYAQAPSTPGLVEESNLSNAQEVSDHLETECRLAESTMTGNANNNTYGDKQEVDWCSNEYQTDDLNINLSKESGEYPSEADVEPFSVDESSLVSKPTSDLSLNPDLELADKNNESSKPNDDHQGPYEIVLQEKSDCEISEGASAEDRGLIGIEVPNNVEIASNGDKSCPDASDLAWKNQEGSLSLDVRGKVASTEKFLFLRPCNSNVGKPDTASGCVMPTDADVQSDVAALETFGREETVMLGKASCVIDNSEETLKENHVQEHASQEDVHQPNIRVLDVNLDDGLVENLNNSKEAEMPAPEKLLSVPEGHVGLHQNMLVEGSFKAFVGPDEGDAVSKIISDKKRSFSESTFTEQSLNSVESSRLVRFKRTVESVPVEDDLLSSILVGRSSLLKIKPTPRLSKVTSMKRTRSAPRSGAPKRKVLVDDAMVLHGDTIRQQLTNTEGIRRVRKKAPCTRTEISKIQKQYLEDKFFLEPIFTGTSLELLSLHSQTCDLSGITVVKSNLNDENADPVETIAEPMLASHEAKNNLSLENASGPHITSHNDEMREACELTKPNADVEASLDVTGVQTSEKDNNPVDCTDIAARLESLYSIGDDASAGIVQPGSLTETFDTNASVNADTSDDENTDVPSVELDSAVMDVVDNGQAISKNELSTVNDGDDINNAGGENEPEARDCVLLSEVPEDGATVEIHTVSSGEPFLMMDGFVNNGENNPGQPEVYQQYMMDAETPGFDLHDQEELKYSAAAGNDTEFLNVDDDELIDHIPDDEEARFTENTGWSSRTRAVSKYLQTLFVKEAELGRKSLHMDSLLVGKSRKEASRMFFEALVLKTRDYIHVDQHNPFDGITIKPRTRLMKSDF